MKYYADDFFAFLVEFKKSHDGNSPKYRDFTREFDCSNSIADYYIKALERAGRIRRTKNGIEVAGGSWKKGA